MEYYLCFFKEKKSEKLQQKQRLKFTLTRTQCPAFTGAYSHVHFYIKQNDPLPMSIETKTKTYAKVNDKHNKDYKQTNKQTKNTHSTKNKAKQNKSPHLSFCVEQTGKIQIKSHASIVFLSIVCALHIVLRLAKRW